MIVTVNHDGRVMDTEIVESSGNLTLDRRAADHCPQRRPVWQVQRGHAPPGRPDRGGLALQVHARRDACRPTSRADSYFSFPFSFCTMDHLLPVGQPGRAQQVALDPEPFRRAHRPAGALRPSNWCPSMVSRRPSPRFRGGGRHERLQCHRAVQVRGRGAGRPRSARGVTLAQACNTLRFDGGRHPRPSTPMASAWSTTSPRNAGVGLAGARCAADRRRRRRARAFWARCSQQKPARVVLANRTPARAAERGRPPRGIGSPNAGCVLLACGLGDALVLQQSFDVVINATSSSLKAPACRCQPACSSPAAWPAT